RAKDRLYVSSVAAPGKKPSRFIDDLLADRVSEARDIERLQVKEQPVIPSPSPFILSEAKNLRSSHGANPATNLALVPPSTDKVGIPGAYRGGTAEILRFAQDDREGARKDTAAAQQHLFGETAPPAAVHPPIAEWAGREPEIKSGEKLRLSASAIEDYEDCPLKFKFGHHLKIPTGPQAALTFGNIMHRSV